MGKVVEIASRRKRTRKGVLRNVPPGRRKNSELRDREYLTSDEVAAMVQQAGKVGRHRIRDRAMILATYRHGFRVSELIDLKWSQVDFKRAEMHVRRLKGGTPSVQPVRGDELRLLRKVKREYGDGKFVFTSERGAPLSRSTVAAIVKRAGAGAKIENAHPHMLRHATGYYLANRGTDTRTVQAYLGHVSIQHTVKYTELAPGRFEDLWD